MTDRDEFTLVENGDQLNEGYFDGAYYRVEARRDNIAENAMAIVVLSYDASLVDQDRDYMVVDMMSDTTGYNNTVCTADTTSTFCTNNCYYHNQTCVADGVESTFICCVTCVNPLCQCPSCTTCIVANCKYTCIVNQSGGTSMETQAYACYLGCEHTLSSGFVHDYVGAMCVCSSSACASKCGCNIMQLITDAGVLFTCTLTWNTQDAFCCSYTSYLSLICNGAANCWDFYCNGDCLCSITATVVCQKLCTVFRLASGGFGSSNYAHTCLTLANTSNLTDSIIATNTYDFGANMNTVYLDWDGCGDCVALSVYRTCDDAVLLSEAVPKCTHYLSSPAQCVYFKINQKCECVSCVDNYAILVSC